jgi:site-specific recombinase XerC
MSTVATRDLTRDAFRRRSRYDLPMPPSDQGDLAALAGSFARDLRDRDLSPNTEYVYLTGVALFGRFLAERHMPRNVAQITGEHVREFFRELRYVKSPNTVASRFRALSAFFKWCVAEGEILKSPMERLERPRIPEAPPELATDDDIRKLLLVCQGTDFLSRRDTAIVRLFFDVGCRRSELAFLRVRDVDLNAYPPVVTFVGKGRRIRTVAIASKAAAALDRYLRARARHKHANLEALWLGRRGAIVDGAIDLMLRRRAVEAGISIHAHMFRHLYVHTALSHPEVKEGDVMAQAGWRSRQMLARYGASAAAERARQAHVRLGLGDRL